MGFKAEEYEIQKKLLSKLMQGKGGWNVCYYKTKCLDLTMFLEIVNYFSYMKDDTASF